MGCLAHATTDSLGQPTRADGLVRGRICCQTLVPSDVAVRVRVKSLASPDRREGESNGEQAERRLASGAVLGGVREVG
jgi:hypothetical protein